MDANEELIVQFYTAFQNKDFQKMQSCYADKAYFSDPVFPNLSSQEVKAMWEMFCRNGKDLSIEYKILNAKDTTVEAQWKASYTFSATGSRVINIINAHFEIIDGKIIRHLDTFNFYKWARQALGKTGLFLGWTSYLKNTVRKQAASALYKFMKNKGLV